jgi:hypothetical protein
MTIPDPPPSDREQAIMQMSAFLEKLLPDTATEDDIRKGATELVDQAITFRKGGMPPGVDPELLSPELRKLYRKK